MITAFCGSKHTQISQEMGFNVITYTYKFVCIYVCILNVNRNKYSIVWKILAYQDSFLLNWKHHVGQDALRKLFCPSSAVSLMFAIWVKESCSPIHASTLCTHAPGISPWVCEREHFFSGYVLGLSSLPSSLPSTTAQILAKPPQWAGHRLTWGPGSEGRAAFQELSQVCT